MVPQECQLAESSGGKQFCNDIYILLSIKFSSVQFRFCRVFMVPQECQLTEILQSFYGASRMSINRDFAEIL